MELSALSNQLQALNGELFQIETNINNVVDSIANTDSRELRKALEDRANKLYAEQTKLTEHISEIQTKIDILANTGQDTEQRLKSIQELIEYIVQAQDQGHIDIRASLWERLRRLVKKIRIDFAKGYISIFSHTGERRLLTLKDGLVFDAYPKKTRD